MAIQPTNPYEFQNVSEELKRGEQLTLRMIGRVFGQPFWEVLVLSLMDSKLAYAELIEMLEQNKKND